jgi:hypothetical protein
VIGAKKGMQYMTNSLLESYNSSGSEGYNSRLGNNN